MKKWFIGLLIIVFLSITIFVFLSNKTEIPKLKTNAGLLCEEVSGGAFVLTVNECKNNGGNILYLLDYAATDLPVRYYYENFSLFAECGGMPLPTGGQYESSSEACKETQEYSKCTTIVRCEYEDPEICEKFEYAKESCYYTFVRSKKDASVCENIRYKEECYGIVLQIAVKEENREICSSFVNPTWKDGCYHSVAKQKKEASICNWISEQSVKDACIRDAS